MGPSLAAVLCLAILVAMLPGKALAEPGVAVMSVSITDMSGNVRKTLAAGTNFVASVHLVNAVVESRRYVAVIEARDPGGVTVSLDLHSGVLAPGQQAVASLILRLDEGVYSLYTFVMDDDKKPQEFSPVVFTPVSVSRINYPGIYVPLYKYPDLSDPAGVWNTLLKAKHDHSRVLFVVTVNPSSGPGTAPNAAYAAAISALKKGGVEYILGYIPTHYAAQDAGHTLADLEGMIDRYREWYPEVNGVSFDQMSSSAADIGFYRDLASYARSHGMEFVRANPGTKADEAYSSGMFDNVVVYEGRALPSALQLKENTHFPWYAPQGFSFISKNVASLDAACVSQLRNYVGLLYITDAVESATDSNPYNKLPTYFAELVGLLDS